MDQRIKQIETIVQNNSTNNNTEDLSLIVESGNQSQIPMPMAAAAREILSQARASDWGSKDFSALADFWCERSGVGKPRLK